jgi:DnaJ family protein A protein 2
MIQQMKQPCEECNGTGQSIPVKGRCKQCSGNRTVDATKDLEVFVEKGMKHDQRITFRGEASESPNTVAGDVIVVLRQAVHARFQRKGAHLFMKKTLSLKEALCGFEFYVTQLDGRQLHIHSRPGETVVKPGDVKALKDEGMPMWKNPYVFGNMYIEFEIEFPLPQQLSDAKLKELERTLPGDRSQPKPEKIAASAMDDGEREIEDVKLVDVDMEVESRRFAQEAHQEAVNDEDHQPHHHHHEQPCQAQ